MTGRDAAHLGTTLITAYGSGHLPDAAAWSVESHLAGCSDCRGLLDATTTPVDDARLDAVFDRVRVAVSAPTSTWPERLLGRLGVPEATSRLLVATRSLTWPWLLGVAFVLACTVLVATTMDSPFTGPSDLRRLSGPGLFVLVAPLLPLAGVAAAFGPRVDPSHDIVRAAPFEAGRLLLIRTLAVVATTVPLTMLAAAVIPGIGLPVVAWVLPALALASIALALTTWLSPLLAVTMTTAGWMFGAVVVVSAWGDPAEAITSLAAQLAAIVVGVAGSWIWWSRRAQIDLVGDVRPS